MEALIHFNELKSWQARHTAGEIYINGMAVLTEKGCYRLTYTDTPGMNLRDGVLVSPTDGSQPSQISGHRAVEADDRNLSAGATPAIPTISAHTSTPPAPPTPPAAVLPPTAVVRMVVCMDCTAEHPEGEECPICSPMLRIAALARERRHAWHKFKRGEGPKP
jgi:hypothetical protein